MKIRPFQFALLFAGLLLPSFISFKAEAAASPSITTQPQSQTNFFGSNVVFTVAASGQAPLSYQWSFNGVNLTDDGHVTGSTTATLTINNIVVGDAGNYQVVVSNSHGSATSSIATLTVLVRAAITAQPTNQSVLLSNNVTFAAAAIGTAPLNYQWYFNGSPLTDGVRVIGSTTANLSISNAQASDAGPYQLFVTNNYGSVTSMVAALTVLIPASITAQPISQVVLQNSNLIFSATVTGTAPLNYQWYFNYQPLTNDGRISGSTTANLQIADVQFSDAGLYQLVVTNNYGSVMSTLVTLGVLVPPSMTRQPVDATVPPSGTAEFFAEAYGDFPLSYQWILNGSPLTDNGRISGSTSNLLIISNAQINDGGAYQLVVTNDAGSVTSAVATLTVVIPPVATIQPANQAALPGSNVAFTATITGTPPFSFQWYFNGTPLTNGGRFSGSTTTNLNIADVQAGDTGSYALSVQGLYAESLSAPATLTVLSPPSINPDITNQTVVLGSNVVFNSGATGPPPFYYQWYFNGLAMTNGGRISGAQFPALTINTVQANDGGPYEIVITNNYGSATSSIATLTVLAPVQITSQPASQAVLVGSNATFGITATGSGSLNYQWYFDGSPLTDGAGVNGSATPALSILNVQINNAGGYFVLVSNSFSSVKSFTASLTPQNTLGPSTRYVALTSTNPLPPYLDWTTAATNIQDAVDAAVTGDSVVVSNGVYGVGARSLDGVSTNRVAINKSIIVQSVNGPASTIINGGPSGFIRTVYLTNGAALIGFTLTNGNAINYGGGVWCGSPSAIVSNCVISGNAAIQYGGGVFGGTLINCVLTNNAGGFGGGAASNVLVNCTLAGNSTRNGYPNMFSGGGAYGCIASNCLFAWNRAVEEGYGGGAAFSSLTACVISNNSAVGGGGGLSSSFAENSLISSNYAPFGGGSLSNTLDNCVLRNNVALDGGAGAYYSALVNCTVVSNIASGGTIVQRGGGIWGGSLLNCIVYYNLSPQNPNYYFPSNMVMNYCCTTPLPASGTGNIVNPPAFVNPTGRDFHLQSTSPCINSGNNAYVTTPTDFDGNPRIAGGTVDIGAYEYQTPASIISYAWLQQYGLPTDGSADFADTDGTGMNNWQKWIAGLNPVVPTSVFAMKTPQTSSSPVGIAVSWLSVSNRMYYLQQATNLAAQPAFSTIQSNIAGQIGTTGFIDTTATNGGPYFYRVGVQH